MRINEHLSDFEMYLKACGFAESTKRSYSRTMKKFCEYLEYGNGPAEITAIRKNHVIGFLANCEENGEKSNTVAVRALTLIKFFRHLKEQGAIAATADPTERIPIPKETQRVPRYVSPAQIEALLNQPDTTTPWGLRDRALLEVIYSSGLRISEALDLELQNISLEEGFIYVRKGKGGKSRARSDGRNRSSVALAIHPGRQAETSFLQLQRNRIPVARRAATLSAIRRQSDRPLCEGRRPAAVAFFALTAPCLRNAHAPRRRRACVPSGNVGPRAAGIDAHLHPGAQRSAEIGSHADSHPRR